MNRAFTVERCLSFCQKRSLGPVIFAVPSSENISALVEACESSQVSGVIFPGNMDESTAVGWETQKSQGKFLPQEYTWQVPPAQASAIVYFGPKWEITYRMVVAAQRHGCLRVVAFDGTEWTQEHIFKIYGRKFARKTVAVGANFLDRFSAKAQRRFQSVPGSIIYRALRQYGGVAHARIGTRLKLGNSRLIERTPLKMVKTKRNDKFPVRHLSPVLAKEYFHRNKIILLNSSLAWGGAERQIVTTLVGLKKRGYTDIELWCEHLFDRPDHDFYLADLESAGVKVKVIDPRDCELNDEDEKQVENAVLAGLPKFEVWHKQLILKLALELYRERPYVVHAWQDSTSINAGYAAAIVGVPRIVLGSRNMAPYHFPYYANYMASSYRDLGKYKNVSFTNNSKQGATDYSKWLHFESDKFSVIHNGIDTERFGGVTNEEVRAYKRRLAIPDGCLLVGSVFRFYREKDPILWVKTAKILSQRFENIRFLIIGTGPMKTEIEKLSKKWKIDHLLHMPGIDKNPKVAVSSMDVFLLTSRQEGTPNVLIEAQLCGVPVVATNVGGVSDTVLDGETGWIVNRRTPKRLASAVTMLLSDEELREHAGTRAVQFSRERFDQNRMLDRTLNLYGLENLSNEAEMI